VEVKIRPLQIADAYTSVKWRNDPEVFKYTGNTYEHEIKLESELMWIQKVISNQNERRFAIIADGEYVGNIYLTDIQVNIGGYHIFIGNKDYWGKGVASAASRLIIEFGFRELNLQTIELKVRPENIAAVRLYNHLGFQYVNDGKVDERGLAQMVLKKDKYKPKE